MDAAFIWNLSKLGRIGSRRLQFDDDFADRLNYQYTSVLLFLFIGLIGVRQYVGKPIQCWIPQEFTRGWEEYAENYCWVANTYFAPVQDRLPPVPDRRELLLVYYQWAPIVMAAQALLFYLPCLTWRLGMAHSGFNLHRILQMAAEANEMVPETAAKTVAILSHYIRSCIQRQKFYPHRSSTSHRVGTYSRLNSGTQLPNRDSTHISDEINGTPAGLVDRASLTTVDEGSLANAMPVMEVDPKESSQMSSTDEAPCDQSGNSEGPTREFANLQCSNRAVIKQQQQQQHSAKTGSGGAVRSDHSGHSTLSGRVRKPAPPPPSTATVVTSATLSFMPSCTNAVENGVQSDETELVRGKSGGKFSKTGSKTKPSKVHGKKCKKSQEVSEKAPPKATTKGTGKACNFLRCGRKHGNFLISLYLTVKCCYLFNVIGQIYLMQSFIGTQYSSYGARVLIDLIKGREWHHSGHFPRVTFCDLEAKKLGKNHVYTLQCVLPLNMFLEKIYIFLWFWHVAIATITFLSLLVWLHRVFVNRSRMHFILNYLKPFDSNAARFHVEWNAHDREFVDSYLGYDGLFIIRLISANCGGMLAGELVYSLWQDFRNPMRKTTGKLFSREHSCCCQYSHGHEGAQEWSGLSDIPSSQQKYSSTGWLMGSKPNHWMKSNRTNLSPPFSRRKYLMVNTASARPFHSDFSHGYPPPIGMKHTSSRDYSGQNAQPSSANSSNVQNFPNGQLTDDIV